MEDIWNKGSLNEWVSTGGDWRTAPATPGLLISEGAKGRNEEAKLDWNNLKYGIDWNGWTKNVLNLNEDIKHSNTTLNATEELVKE